MRKRKSEAVDASQGSLFDLVATVFIFPVVSGTNADALVRGELPRARLVRNVHLGLPPSFGEDKGDMTAEILRKLMRERGEAGIGRSQPNGDKNN